MCAPRPQEEWHENFTLCPSCYELKKKGNYCPLCMYIYDDNDFDSKVCEGVVRVGWTRRVRWVWLAVMVDKGDFSGDWLVLGEGGCGL